MRDHSGWEDGRVGEPGEVDHRSSRFFEMSPTAPAKKTGSKPESKLTGRKNPPSPPEPVDLPSSGDEEGWEDEDSGDGSESDEEDDGVDEVGFEKLIKALGDDALNEYDQAHLVALNGDEEGDESEGGEAVEEGEGVEEVSGSEDEDEEVPEEGDEGERGASGSGSEGEGAEEGESSSDEDVLALDELEDVELHPDAVPRRGVRVVDNKVRVARV